MKTRLGINRPKFDDFPREILLQKYEKNKQAFVDYFQCHPAVAAIYEMGSISTPGISDLDLILVLKDNAVLSSSDFEFLACLDKYIFLHPPFTIPEALFPYVHYLFYASNLQKLTGINYSFIGPKSEAERIQLGWLMCAEAAVSRLRDIIYQVTIRHHISLRKMLLKLYSIKHNVNLFKIVAGKLEKDEWRNYVDHITELRSSWFTLRSEEQLARTFMALNSGVDLLLDIIDNIALLLQRIFNDPIISDGQFRSYYILPTSLQILKFEPLQRSKVRFLTNPLSHIGRLGIRNNKRIALHVNDLSVFTLPKELLLLFWPGKSKLSNIEKRLKKNLIVQSHVDPNGWQQQSMCDLIQFRFCLFTQYDNFIHRNNLSKLSRLAMGSWLLEKNKSILYRSKRLFLRGLVQARFI